MYVMPSNQVLQCSPQKIMQDKEKRVIQIIQVKRLLVKKKKKKKKTKENPL